MSHWRGHPVTEREGIWYYADGTKVSDDPDRDCGHCGLANTPEGHDGCLGTLPGVMNACCGHGDARDAYVQYKPADEDADTKGLRQMTANYDQGIYDLSWSFLKDQEWFRKLRPTLQVYIADRCATEVQQAMESAIEHNQPVFKKYQRPDDINWAGWYEIEGKLIGHKGLDGMFVAASVPPKENES